MSDKIKGFIVTLDEDYSEEDSKNILEAISMIKGVVNVESKLVNHDDHINRIKIINELKLKFYDFIKNI